MPNLARWGAALLLPLLAACNTNNSNPFAATVPQPLPSSTASVQDQNFAQQAASSDAFEIQSSQLALQKSRSRPVRAFAQQMIDDHTASTQALSALAAAKGITATGMLDPTQQQMLASLRTARGGFDRAYLRDQVRGHTATVAAFQAEINNGYDADVTGLAKQTLPMIQGHLDAAKALASR